MADMRWCVVCGREYRPEVVRCSWCLTDLVVERPATPILSGVGEVGRVYASPVENVYASMRRIAASMDWTVVVQAPAQLALRATVPPTRVFDGVVIGVHVV